MRKSTRGSRSIMSWPAKAAALLVALVAIVAVAAPALAHQATTASSAAVATTAAAAAGGQSGLADLSVKTAKMTCAELATTTSVAGEKVSIAEDQVGSASTGGPEYCAMTGHINTYIGFEILLPINTWRQRYLQVGCGGLCGNIGLNAPQTTDFAALADGDFVVAGQDEGHSGNGVDWYSNGAQRVDFAYLSDHDLAKVSKGLAQLFYGLAPRYSYFDGCSQGGHQALTEAQRYPSDFNGILAGAPATIMTELNSILHEYEFRTVLDAAGKPILDETQAQIVLDAAMKSCNARVGLMLNYRACEQSFKLSSVACTTARKTDCLTGAQIAAVKRILAGPVDAKGTKLYPDGYSLASAFDWDNGTGPNIPATAGASVSTSTFITNWYQYFAFEKNLGDNAVADQKFTLAAFNQIEKLAPFWDDTDPYLQPFAKAGGKLILWQGTGDWSIPTDSSLAYYQAVVKASGGLAAAAKFSRYYQLPSVGHCGGNGPDTYAGVQDVASWVETGHAPHAIVAREYATTSTGGAGGHAGGGGPGGGSGASSSDLTDQISALGGAASGTLVRSLKVFPYPEVPVYTGHGSVDDASSFVGKVSTAVEQPLPWAGSFTNVMIFCNDQGIDCRKRLMPKK